MAKREFIEKQKAENITRQEPYYHDPINVCSEIRDKIRELHTFTEQDIVKPYLDLLKEQVSKSCYKALITDDGDIKESKVLQIIDNLLTEQGDKE